MECRNTWSELYDFLKEKYGVFNMSLSVSYREDLAKIEMCQGGLMKLVNDLMYLKSSRKPATEGVPESPQDEIKCTFDEVMKFNE